MTYWAPGCISRLVPLHDTRTKKKTLFHPFSLLPGLRVVVGLQEPLPAVIGEDKVTPWTSRRFIAGPQRKSNDRLHSRKTHKQTHKMSHFITERSKARHESAGGWLTRMSVTVEVEGGKTSR